MILNNDALRKTRFFSMRLGKIAGLALLILALVMPPSLQAQLQPLGKAGRPDCGNFQKVQMGGGGILMALIIWFNLYLQLQMRHDTTRIVNSNRDAANAINKLRKAIYDKETERDFLPAPLSCIWLENTELAKEWLRLLKGLVRKADNAILDILARVEDAVPQEMARALRHRELYCSASERDSGLCDNIGILPHGDVSAAIFMTANQYASPEEEQAAQDYIANLANLAAPAIPKHLYATAQGQQLQAKTQHLLAMKSLANASLQGIFQARRPDGQGGNSARVQLLTELQRRFGSQKWLDKISDEQASPGALQREGLLMRSWEMQLRLLEYEQNERIEALLAALLADRSEEQETVLVRELSATLRAQEAE